MCFFSPPSMPSMPAPPPVPQVKAAPTIADPNVALAADSERRRRLAQQGRNSTVMTSTQGLTSNSNSGTTLVKA